MSIGRKFSEPVTVYDAYGRPTPEPVLVHASVAEASERFAFAGDGVLETPTDTPYAGIGIRFVSSFFGTYYNRVYAIPRSLALVDPDNGDPNTFYLWNASFETVELTDIAASGNTGLTLSFDVGLVLDEMVLGEVAVIVTPAAPVAADADYSFTFDNGFVAPFFVSLLRTNLLLLAPEVPVNQTLEWKTNILTARDGTEQRFGVRQLARESLSYKFIYESTDQEREVYAQFFAKGGEVFSVPIWHDPIRLMEAATAGATQVKIDTARYDVGADDQLYIEHDDGSYEIVRVEAVQFDGTTISLYTALLADVPTTRRIYRVTTVYLPSRPTLRRGAYQHLETTLDLRLTTARELYTGDAVAVEIGQTTQLRDRVISSTVYTLGGVPIMHGRPLVEGTVDESFDWNYEVLDYETGVFDQTTPLDKAAVTYERMFYARYPYQKFFYNYAMDHMHGQRRPVWLPTWQQELNGRVTSAIGTTVIIGDERYFDDFPADSSHRGLWFRWTQGWLARRVVAVAKDGEGNTVVEIEPALPLDFPASPPYQVGFLVLARLGSDEVQIEHRAAYSLLNMTFQSTNSTDEGV